MEMTGSASASHGIGSETPLALTVSQKTPLVCPIVSGFSKLLILTGNLEGAEIHEEDDEREDGSSRPTTQTTETPVVLDSEAQAHPRRVGQDEQIRESPPRDGALPVSDSHRRRPRQC